MPRKNKPASPPRRRETPLATRTACQRKQRFVREHMAVKAAEMQSLISFSDTISTYHCTACKGWHLTSTK